MMVNESKNSERSPVNNPNIYNAVRPTRNTKKLNKEDLSMRMQVSRFDDRLADRGDGCPASPPGLVADPVPSVATHPFEIKPIFVNIEDQRSVSSV